MVTIRSTSTKAERTFGATDIRKKTMIHNVGTVDKIIRLTSGAILIAPLFITPVDLFPTSAITIASAMVGTLIMSTALISFCPLYRMVGVRTTKGVEK